MDTGQDHGLAPDRILRQIETSLERLGVDRVDLYLAHEFDPQTPYSESVRRIRAAGRGGDDRRLRRLELRRRAGGGRARGRAGRRSSRTRTRCSNAATRPGVLPLCAERGLDYQAFSPLAGGWLTGKYRPGEPHPEGSRMTLRPGRTSISTPSTSTAALDGLAGARRARRRRPRLAWVLEPGRDGGRRRPAAAGASRAGAGGARPHAVPWRARRDRGHSSPDAPRPQPGRGRAAPRRWTGCIEAMAGALAALARGEMDHAAALRSSARRRARAASGLMPAHRAGDDAALLAEDDLHLPGQPEARARRAPGRRSTLFDGETGEVAGADERVGDHRDPHRRRLRASRPGCSRARTRTCSRSSAPASRRARISRRCGRVRDFDEIRLFSRDARARRRRSPRSSGSRRAEPAEEAVRGADVVVTATNATRAGARALVAEGGRARERRRCTASRTTRELDPATVAAAALFVDRRESAENEAGDYLRALEEGAIGARPHPRRDRRGADRDAAGPRRRPTS